MSLRLLGNEHEAARNELAALLVQLGQTGASPSAILAIRRLQAEAALAAGAQDEAMTAAQAVLDKYPGDALMLHTAARAAALRRQFNLAAEYQQSYCRLAGDVAAYMELASYFAESGDERATDAFSQALSLAPQDPTILAARSSWHERNGRRDAAVADLRSLLEFEPDNREAARNLARLLAVQQPGSGGEGEEQLRNVLRTDPTPAAYLDLLEIVGSDPLRRQEYENLYNDMLARFRNQSPVVLHYARRLLEQEKYSAALEQFQRGEGIDPANHEYALGIGDCFRSMGGYQDAQPAYERALRLSYDPRAVAGLARSLDKAGQGAQAERLFRDQLNERPRDSELVMQHGLFLFERSQYTEALEQYDYGQQLDPGNEQFINRAALCLFMLNQIPEAIERLKKAINVNPRPLFYRNLAIAYEEDAETELAEQYYLEGIELFPGDARLLESYSEFLEQQGRSDDALEVLSRSAQQTEDTDILMDLATLAQSAGNSELARSTYERAIALDPFDLVINERFATFLSMEADNNALRSLLEDATGLLSPEDYDELIGTMTGFWIEQRKVDDGMLLLAQLIEMHPAIARLYNSLALMQHLGSDNETALTTVKRGQRYAGESFLGLYLEALISWRHIGVEEALPLGAKLIEHPEADAKSWLLYLDMLANAKQRGEEARVAALGLRRFFGNEKMYEHLVTATRELGDIRELIRVLEDPQYVRIRHEQRPLLLGRSYIAVGNYVKALASLQPVIEEDGFNEEALQLMGEACFMEGRREEAREHLTTALAINPELAGASVWLGWVLLEDRDLAGAQQSFSAAEKSPTLNQVQLAWTRLGQAAVAIRRGERLEAQGLLKQAEALGKDDPSFLSYLPNVRSEIKPD